VLTPFFRVFLFSTKASDDTMSLRRRLDDSDHAESSQSALKRKRMAVDDESENEDLSNMDSDNDEEDSNQPTASLVFDHPVAPLPVGDDG
jgi:hypothetical protein